MIDLADLFVGYVIICAIIYGVYRVLVAVPRLQRHKPTLLLVLRTSVILTGILFLISAIIPE